MAEEIMEMNRLTITNEDGLEIECEILFTFDSEEYEKSYVVFSPMGEEFVDEDGYPELHAASYTPNGEGEGVLTSIEDDAEWDMIEEIIASFLEAEDEDDDELIS